jgi:hypothetical protein
VGVRCSLGFHAGTWRYVRSGSCDQERVCNDCRKVSRRTEHEFGEWALDNPRSGSCKGSIKCKRCGGTSSSYKHNYKWTFRNDDECVKVQTCIRCGGHTDMGGTKVEHVWGDWKLNRAGDGRMRICRRCGELQAKQS